MPIKLTVNLPEGTVKAVETIAKENGISVTETLRQLLDSQTYLHNEIKNGSKVVLESPDDRTRELVFATSRNLRKSSSSQ
jgi:DNA-binding ferritin-like protein